MADIPALTSFTPGTVIRSGEVNANFAAIRNAFNNTAVLTDEIATITVNHIFNVNQTFKGGVTVSGLGTFTSGITVSGAVGTFSSGVTFASGITVTASGVTVAGNIAFSSTVSCAGTMTVFGTITASNAISTNDIAIRSTASAAIPGVRLGLSNTGLYGDSNSFNIAVNTVNCVTINSTAALVVAPFSFVVGATLTTNATVGFIYAPTAPGTSTGTPVTQTGTVALCYDTTNNRLQVYNGGWKTVLLA